MHKHASPLLITIYSLDLRDIKDEKINNQNNINVKLKPVWQGVSLQRLSGYTEFNQDRRISFFYVSC